MVIVRPFRIRTYTKFFSYFLVFLFVWFGMIYTAEAARLTYVSDTISNSAPSVSVNHTIGFTASSSIPASGKIIITPQADAFSIPSDLDYTDVDFLDDGVQKVLASTPGSGAGSAIGVLAVNGTSGSFTFTLNDTDAVDAASAVVIRIGTNAVFGATGDKQIQNPSATSSYKIDIKTYTSANVLIDIGQPRVAIVAPVTMTAGKEIVCGDRFCEGSENCSNCPTDCGSCPVIPPSGGGGGGITYVPPTEVIFSGRAYPKSLVTLLKDAQIAATTIAGPDANFSVTLSGLSGGNYIFSIYSEDNRGIRSSLLTFPVSVTSGATTKVSGIFISPTIAVDKNEVRRGDNIAIFGQSAPKAEVTITVNSEEEFFVKTPSDKDGVYLYYFNTTLLEMGQHFTKSKAALDGTISSFSKVISFIVGTKNVLVKPVKCPPKADLNNDCRVNLVDFSIAAYWYKRPLSPAFKTVEGERLNGDGKIDLVDFSIMAFYWTG